MKKSLLIIKKFTQELKEFRLKNGLGVIKYYAPTKEIVAIKCWAESNRMRPITKKDLNNTTLKLNGVNIIKSEIKHGFEIEKAKK